MSFNNIKQNKVKYYYVREENLMTMSNGSRTITRTVLLLTNFFSYGRKCVLFFLTLTNEKMLIFNFLML
jgi:hypothetical protein